VESLVSNQIHDPHHYGEKHALRRLFAYLVNHMNDESAKTKADNAARTSKHDIPGPSEQSRITYKVLDALDKHLRGRPINKHNALSISPDIVTRFYPVKARILDIPT